jgi:hypothetical protein
VERSSSWHPQNRSRCRLSLVRIIARGGLPRPQLPLWRRFLACTSNLGNAGERWGWRAECEQLITLMQRTKVAPFRCITAYIVCGNLPAGTRRREWPSPCDCPSREKKNENTFPMLFRSRQMHGSALAFENADSDIRCFNQQCYYYRNPNRGAD